MFFRASGTGPALSARRAVARSAFAGSPFAAVTFVRAGESQPLVPLPDCFLLGPVFGAVHRVGERHWGTGTLLRRSSRGVMSLEYAKRNSWVTGRMHLRVWQRAYCVPASVLHILLSTVPVVLVLART